MPFTNLPLFNIQTGSYAVLASDDVVDFNLSAAATATLPSASSMATGDRITLKNVNTSSATGIINVLTTGGQTIDGRASGSIFLSPNDFLQVVSDGTNWKTIVMQETITAFYFSNVAQSLPSATEVLVDFQTKGLDTHSAVTIGASWKFTAPAAGLYSISSMLSGNFASWAGASLVNTKLFKNNSVQIYIAYVRTAATTGSDSPSPNGTVVIRLAAGDFIDVRMSQDTGTSKTLSADPSGNRVYITKVGN